MGSGGISGGSGSGKRCDMATEGRGDAGGGDNEEAGRLLAGLEREREGGRELGEGDIGS